MNQCTSQENTSLLYLLTQCSLKVITFIYLWANKYDILEQILAVSICGNTAEQNGQKRMFKNYFLKTELKSGFEKGKIVI